MKKIPMGIALALAISGTSLAAHAAGPSQGFYVGGGYSFDTYSESGFEDASLGALFVRGGFQINDYLAVEARVGSGVQDDTINYYGYDIHVELQDIYGVYLKAGLPTASGLYPYVMLGTTHAKVKAKVGGYSASSSDSDVSYGIGADYWFDQQLSAGLEYAKFYDKDNVEIKGWTLGLNYLF